MPPIVGTITQAQPKYVPRRDGSGEFPIYQVWIDGQGPFVCRKDVFNIASSLLGQVVEAQTRTEQKGNFIDHYMDFVTGTGQMGAMPQTQQPVQQAQQAQAQRPQQMQTQAQPNVNPQQGTVAVYTGDRPPYQERPQAPQTAADVVNAPNPERTSIQRQKATDVALGLGTDNPIDYWQNVGALIHFYETGQMPVLVGGTTPPALNNGPARQNAGAYSSFKESNPEPEQTFIPAGYVDPGPDPSKPVDDDIPFLPTIDGLGN